MKYSRQCACSPESQNKRQQILEAAYVVFSRKGYHKATVDEIIALADTGKGTVYNYFVNKEQLFYTLLKERSQSFEEALAQIKLSQEPPLQKVETLIRALLLFYRDNADLCRAVMYEVRGLGVQHYTTFTKEQCGKYQEWFAGAIGVIEQVLREGKAQGVIRQHCDEARVAHSLFGVIVTLVFRNYVDNIDEMAHGIAEFLLYGVATQ